MRLLDSHRWKRIGKKCRPGSMPGWGPFTCRAGTPAQPEPMYAREHAASPESRRVMEVLITGIDGPVPPAKTGPHGKPALGNECTLSPCPSADKAWPRNGPLPANHRPTKPSRSPPTGRPCSSNLPATPNPPVTLDVTRHPIRRPTRPFTFRNLPGTHPAMVRTCRATSHLHRVGEHSLVLC